MRVAIVKSPGHVVEKSPESQLPVYSAADRHVGDQKAHRVLELWFYPVRGVGRREDLVLAAPSRKRELIGSQQHQSQGYAAGVGNCRQARRDILIHEEI